MSTIPMPTSSHEPIALELALPWVIDEQRERKLKRDILIACCLVVFLLVVAQFLPVFTVTQEQPEITKTVLLLEPKEIPETIESYPEPEVVLPPKVVEKPAKTIGKATAVVPKPIEVKPDVIQSQGLDAVSSQLASLSSAVDLQKLRKKNVSSSVNGTVAQNNISRLGADQVTRRSGGVVIDDEVMKSNVAALASRETTSVDGLDLSGGISSKTNAYGNLRSGTRDMESVRQALEAAKSRIYVRYQRALLDNPDLAGKFRFQLVIEPDGSISSLSLLYSELNLQHLERDILAHIQSVNFGEKEVITTEVEYTYVFLPS